MISFDAGQTLADRFRAHAGDDDHLNAHAMRGMAEDWEAGGPVRQVCAGYEDAPQGAVIQLRLLAGVFRLVLTGRAPGLRPYYACLGGDLPPEAVWPAMRPVIADHVAELREALSIPPQTNEVGRSAALLAGLFDLVAATGVGRIRLLELGASGGLNLLPDRFRYTGSTGQQTWSWGDATSPVEMVDAIDGPLPPQDFTISSRRGCDPDPVDIGHADGRLLLTSFVWPFQLQRHVRLAAALEVAAPDPPPVDRATAAAWLPEQLASGLGDGLTVVWQSITRMYWPQSEISAVERILDDAGQRGPLGHVAMEYVDDQPMPAVITRLWRPGDRIRQRHLGTAHHHGVPVRVTAPSG
jgi:hypothetical protein